MNYSRAVFVGMLLFLSACAQSPGDKQGSSNQRTLVIFCGILGACEIEHADNTHGELNQEEGNQDVSPDIDLTPI